MVKKISPKAFLLSYGKFLDLLFIILEDNFIVDSNFKHLQFFKYSFGITQFDNDFFKVLLKFSSAQKGYLMTQPLHSSQKLITEDKDSFTIELEVYLTYELIESVLSYGEDVLVLQPEELKKIVHKRLLKAVKQY